MMYLLSILLLSLAGLVSVQAQQPASDNITINALPAFSTCRPAQIDWRGGSPPYRVYIHPEGWTNQTDWIVELPITTRASTTWNVNLAAGTGIVVNVWDGVNDQFSEPAWIQDSGDNACLVSNGTFQSDRRSSSTIFSISSTPTSPNMPMFPSGSVVSTPSSGPATTQPPPASSVISSETPPATVTLIQPNGAGLAMALGPWVKVLMLCLGLSVMGMVL